MAGFRDAKAGSTGPMMAPPLLPVDRARMGLRVQGRYRIVSELGTGSFGTVCLADDEATAHAVAIRFLSGEPAGVAHAAQVLRRRGRSIVEASTAHPALVGVLEFGELEDNQAFVAMEVAPGRRLSEILAEGLLDVPTALRWAIELGGAIETLHNLGIVHGALRPRNVRIGDDGSVKLMDVELADLRAELARTGIATAEPPPEYLSPEQIRRGPVSEKTDVYAFAIVLYEMLCGVPPFRAATPEAILAKQLTESPTPMRRRRSVPASVSSIVALALSKHADERPLIQNVLNSLWQEAHVPAARWKRSTAILGGTLLAASIPVIVSWALFMPRPPVASVLPLPTPSPAAEPAPVQGSPASSTVDTATPTVPASPVATPVTVPAAPVRATPPPGPSTASRAATSERPARATPPSAPPAASRAVPVERQEQTRTPSAPVRPALEPPPSSNSNDDPDPGAVVDWLLERAAARRK